MNWIDVVIILILLLFTLEGYGRNFILESADFLSFVLAFILSIRFYSLAANFYQTNFQVAHSLSTVLGFITVWFLTETVFFSLVHFFIIKFRVVHRKVIFLNRLSIIPAFFRGLVLIAILLVLIGTFPIQPKIKKDVYDSKIGSVILSKAQQLEVPLKNIFGGLSQDTLTFLTIKPKSEENINLGFSTVEFYPNSTLENQMIDLVNRERRKRGFKTLVFDPKLREVGRVHSADMFKRGYFSHYSPEGKNVADRANENDIKYLVIGENLAYAPNLELAHSGLMNSPGHKANILSSDFNKIGVGIMDGGVYGLMITQVFTN